MPAQMRKDALRSRRAILDAARELYRDDAEASFAEIAHRAGVGQATVYRHFTDRRAILLELVEEDMQVLEERVGAEPIEPGSLESMLDLMISMQLGSQGALGEIRLGQVDETRIRALTDRTLELLAPRLEAAKEGGVVRSDLGLDDLLVLLAMIDGALAHASAPGGRKAAGARAFQIAMDGLRLRR
ncbi:MAG: helix-turn-helix domain-containing protein [Solirubrobacterales bacterium]